MTSFLHYTKHLHWVEQQIYELQCHPNMFQLTAPGMLEPTMTQDQSKKLQDLIAYRMSILNEIALVLGYKLVKNDRYNY